MADLLAKLQAEAAAQPDETTRDRYGNRTLPGPGRNSPAYPGEASSAVPRRADAVAECFGARESADDHLGTPHPVSGQTLEEALEASLYETGDVLSVVTGEPVEPDHPDSPLVREGLM